jgi:hypothetical protein
MRPDAGGGGESDGGDGGVGVLTGGSGVGRGGAAGSPGTGGDGPAGTGGAVTGGSGGTSAGGGADGGTDQGGMDGGAGGGVDAGGVTSMAPEVSRTCIDGMYRETLPTTDRSLSDLVSSYSAAGFQSFAATVLERRYPLGKYILDHAASEAGSDCLDFFVSSRGTAGDVLGELSTAVHECGHALDGARGAGNSSYFLFTETLSFSCSGGGFEGPHPTFSRSRIRRDAFAAARPPCPAMGPNGCDSYADTYLDGNPDDAKFDSGDQGFNMLLEEAVQYTNSLATDYALADQNQGNISAKDGILTMLWYVERYLAMARKDHPADYDFLAHDATWQKAILTLWGRAWLYLDNAQGIRSLGIDTDQLLPLVRTPALLDEIDRIRKAAGCP